MRSLFSVLMVMAISFGGLSAVSRAQESYPDRALTIVVPVPPGGAADFIARQLGQKLSEALGQPVIISNRGGASGTIASEVVAKSAADGYTLLLNSITTHGIGPHLFAKLPYDPVGDFTPIARVAELPLIMTISSARPMQSAADVVAYAKANPGKLSFASSGNGGAPHLAGELFKVVSGVDLVHVPYRGSAPAVIDVSAGRVDIMFDAAPSLLPMIKAGKLRPLASASLSRHPLLPDVPTFNELGMTGIEISLWYGLLAPAKTPSPVVERLNAELRTILGTAAVQESFAKEGAVPSWDVPSDYAAFMRAESARWGAIVAKNNIKIE